MYHTKTTFNCLKEGQFFTFRKSGDPLYPQIANECYKVDEYVKINGITYHINVRDLAGGASYIKNKRAIVWTD